jgi:ketopantoate reductase
VSLPRVAVLGAGAVGAVYGHHLKRGGAHLTYVVRPKYADEVRAGIRMWRGAREERVVPDAVVTDIGELRGTQVDQLWLCVPSTSLDDETLQRTAAATGEALVVDLSPGIEGRSLRAIGRERLVDGLIPFIAWQTPLPGVAAEAARPPGIAYWLPPFVPTSLSGPRAREAAQTLRAGGMAARVVPDVEVQRALGSAVLQGFIATLEVSGWSLRACKARLDGATGDAVRAMARKKRVGAFPFSVVARPLVMRALLTLAPPLVPVPLEPYLKFHFTKVGAQSRVMMRSFVQAADEAGLAAPDLRRLAHALR